MICVQIQQDSLAKASLRLNPTLRGYDSSVALGAITKVDLSGNHFEHFPECLLMLPSLVELDVSGNLITEIPEEDDALSINFMCPSLEALHLKDNKLASFPAYFFRFPVLKYLDLSQNRLKDLPSEVWTAPSLISLNLTR
jgi:Leucine-rich repeat (LRR) protein